MTATIILLVLIGAAGTFRAVMNSSIRNGRSVPHLSSRTRLKPRGVVRSAQAAAEGDDGSTRLVAAGFAATVMGPLTAAADGAVKRLTPVVLTLEQTRQRLGAAIVERDEFVDQLKEGRHRYLLSRPRSIRWITYVLALAADLSAGLIIAHEANIGGIAAYGIAASIGFGLFFAGKLIGLGIARLDTEAPQSRRTTTISIAAITIGAVAVASLVAALFAARRVAEDFAIYAARQLGQAPLEKSPFLTNALLSLIVVGSVLTTLYWAIRQAEGVQLLEQLEFRIFLRRTALNWKLRLVRRPLARAARLVSLAQAAEAELYEIAGDRSEIWAWEDLFKKVSRLDSTLDEHARVIAELETPSRESSPGTNPDDPDLNSKRLETWMGDDLNHHDAFVNGRNSPR